MRIFNVHVPSSILGLIVSEIVLITSCFLLAVFLVSDVDPEVWLFYDGGAGRLALMVLTILVGLYLQDLYTKVRVTSKSLLMQQCCLVLGLGFLFQALLSYTAPSMVLPRWIMMIGSGLVLVFLPAWRILYAAMVLHALGAERVLFLGTSPVVLRIAQRIEEHPELGLSILGFVGDSGPGLEGTPPERMLGSMADFKDIVVRTRPDLIVVGLPERRQRLPVYELLDMRFSGIRIEEAATTYERAFSRISINDIRPSQLIFTHELGPRPNIVRLQSFYSTLIALAAFLIAVPAMILITILIRVTSPGPILYRQRRVGLNSVPFVVYKFRSMRVDAEAETGAIWASTDDPRVTTLGRWLRRLRLDELPQLFNVLRGEMSIVGPRPERPEFIATLTETIPFYRQRLCVRPGITGWAQINHKYGDTLEDSVAKLEYDLYYIKNLNPTLDAYIIFHTLKVMLLFRGSQ